VICIEKPHKLLTVAQAADLAGVANSSIYGACSPSNRYNGKAGPYHFRWADSPAPTQSPSTLPRSRNGHEPINPMRQTAAEVPTHDHIRAD
jgi:hypothetical protein